MCLLLLPDNRKRFGGTQKSNCACGHIQDAFNVLYKRCERMGHSGCEEIKRRRYDVTTAVASFSRGGGGGAFDVATKIFSGHKVNNSYKPRSQGYVSIVLH